MANDKNKIHNLVSESDEDTSELEVLAGTIAAEPDDDYESESDAATHAFESLNKTHDDQTVAQLKAELRERDDNIDRLEFDVEQLRARWTGLETELKVREELTTKVTAELERTRQELAAAHEHLATREQAIAALESNVRQQDDQLNDSRLAYEQSREDAEKSLSEIAELKNRNIEALSRIDTLVGELHEEKSARHQAEEAEQSLIRASAKLEEQHAESLSLVASLHDYIDGRKGRWEKQEADLRKKDELLKDQHRKIGQFIRDIKKDTKRLRNEQAARQDLQTRQEILQTDNERLRSETESLKELVAETQVLLTAEQEQTRSLTATLNDTVDALDRERSQREKQDEAVALQLAEIDSLTARLGETADKLEKERSGRLELETQAAGFEQQAERLATEVAELSARVEKDRALQHEHAELTGRVASNAATVKELHARLSKTEDYADTLRIKLQSQLAAVESLTSGRENLEAAVGEARQRIGELNEQLEAERQSNADLASEVQENQRKFEEEIRTIRFELDAAQETMSESQTLNEQLTSDLIENSGFRRALESQIAEADAEHQKESTGLNKKLKRLQQQLDEYERKITNKDAAINALLSELANKPQEAEAENEPEAVVHRLADRKSPGSDDRQNPEKDRITRLLIGNIDGQELRFPLFKNKLTIGRTAHNDIQLKAQYISRRHAVVVSDDTCTRIVDWGSKNGIYVNGVRVTEKILKNGDKLTVGTARFKFEERHKR